jgi:hypothetical protein
MLIHVSLTDMTIEVSFLEYLHHIIGALDNKSGQIFYVDSSIFIVQF